MSNNSILRKIENSFSPFVCKAKVLGYDDGICFKVIDVNQHIIIEKKDPSESIFNDENRLIEWINASRTEIEENGYRLDPL